ncbi:MAG: SpoIIE family protein phosphatase [Planctomycetes bacterium]|nr:SpoIIE family protein phosphatase [Planctomycetota bacterium]
MSHKKQQTPVDAVVRTAARLDRKVRRLNRNLSRVLETSRLLTAPLNLQKVLDTVVETVAKAIGCNAAGLRLLDEESGEMPLKATFGLTDTYINKGPVTIGESTHYKQAFDGETIIVDDMRFLPNFKKYHPQIKKEGLISSLTIGLTYHNKGIGLLRLYSKRKRKFSPADISLAQTIAAQSVVAIINARLYQEALEGERMARQLKLAGAVQQHLIPEKSPDIPGFDLAGIYVPCYEVGGDFYDFISLDAGRFVLTIGDVMGKGPAASLAMASLRASLRAFAEQYDQIDDLINRVNRMFCQDNTFGEFATLFCASLMPDYSCLTYCNCGHEPPLLLRGQEVISLSEGGTIIGLDPDTPYQLQKVDLQKDDILVMYTDGLADAVNFQRESFGKARIIEAVQASAVMAAEPAAKNILWLMRKFAGLTKRYDDTALVVLKKTE